MKKFFGNHPLILSFLMILLSILAAPVAFELGTKESPYATKLMLGLNYSSMRLANGIRDGIADSWNDYVDLVDTNRENSDLRRQLEELRRENLSLTETRLENERLRKLLNYRKSSPGKVLGARVIGGSSSVADPGFLIIDKGASSGVREGVSVFTNMGAVGTVHSVAERNSVVMLAMNPMSIIDAVVQRTRARGIITGSGNHFVMKYIEGEDSAAAGDKIISSGKDGIFPKNLVIGTVKRVEPDGGLYRAVIRPEIDVSAVEEVLVTLGERSLPTDRLE